jgi:hypothetical protein
MGLYNERKNIIYTQFAPTGRDNLQIYKLKNCGIEKHLPKPPNRRLATLILRASVPPW